MKPVESPTPALGPAFLERVQLLFRELDHVQGMILMMVDVVANQQLSERSCANLARVRNRTIIVHLVQIVVIQRMYLLAHQ